MFVFSSCSLSPSDESSNQNPSVGGTTSTSSATPYATVATLDAITNETDASGKLPYVYWRVARAFSMIQLESFRDENKWYNAKLSERPVLVYDSKSRPKYYEFRVVRDGEEIGAITAVAQKKDGGPTAFVLPHPSDYSGLSTKAGEADKNFKIVANGYPHVAYGVVSKAGDEVSTAIDPSTGENVTPEADPLEYALAHPEMFTNSNITVSMVSNYVSQTISSNQEEWTSMGSIQSNLVMLSTNDEITAEFFEGLHDLTKATSFDGGTIVGNNSSLAPTNGWWDWRYVTNYLDWGWTSLNEKGIDILWCGPSAVEMYLTYYGLTSKIKGVDGLIALGNKMGIATATWNTDGLVTTTDLIDGLNWATDNKMEFHYYLPMDWWFGDGSWWANASHSTTWYRVKAQVDEDDICILGRTGTPNECCGHYRIALGYKANDIYKTVNDYGYKVVDYRKAYFLWWSWWEPIKKWMVVGSHQEFVRTDRYMLITDGNGYERNSGENSPNKNKPKIEGASPQLFWENAKNNSYSFFSVIWK